MTTQVQFESFQLPTPLQKALHTLNYSHATPIQEQAIPMALKGLDVIGVAQTGTGKTAAFGIPLISKLLEDPKAQAVVLVPTRELAMQVHQVMNQLSQNVKAIKTWVIIGGTSMYAQTRSLPKHPRLIVATPGRLADHLQQKTFSLSEVRMVVLDEADRMLDIGFEPQIRKILEVLPKERQTLLFSATFPKAIDRLVHRYMVKPTKIVVGKISEPAKDVEQSFVETTAPEKNNLLAKELSEREGSVMVFVRTKYKVDRVTKMLIQAGHNADRIHGDRTQGQRNRVLHNFRNGTTRILVATDVASRGLDVSHIMHVINYDIPESSEDYVHRIGRTARAGSKGFSLTFITPEDREKWASLSRHLNRGSGLTADRPLSEGSSKKFSRRNRSKPFRRKSFKHRSSAQSKQ